jgi:hypothetical protein
MTYRDIPLEVIPELLEIDLANARFWWRERSRAMFQDDGDWKTWNKRFAGIEAGLSRNPSGYRQITLLGRSVPLHHLVWALAHGAWAPQGMPLDHIDGNKLNNRPSNLRLATPSQNARNRSAQAQSSSRFLGVSRRTKKRRSPVYEAVIWADGEQEYLGQYPCEKEAALAYNIAAARLHGDFAKFNEVFA